MRARKAIQNLFSKILKNVSYSVFCLKFDRGSVFLFTTLFITKKKDIGCNVHGFPRLGGIKENKSIGIEE